MESINTEKKPSNFKKYLPGVGVLVMAVGIFWSAGHKGWVHSEFSTKEVQKTDTVSVAAAGPQGNFLDSAIRVVGRTRAFADSTGLSGKWVPYTLYKLGQLTDTLKDKNGKLVLDTAGHITRLLSYKNAPFVDTSLNKFIQVITLPKR